jgi:CrcB protein
MIKNILLVGLGGFIGASSRYIIQQLIKVNQSFYTTLLINIIGSFFIGLIIAYSLKNNVFNNNWKLFLATGICGGFTTFSTFSLENYYLFLEGKYLTALTYIAISVIVGLIAVFLGIKLIS